MLRLPMVLLLHRTPQGAHYDWLLANPQEPTGRLWSARVSVPSFAWPQKGAMLLQTLPPHRREYLSYQGPLSPLKDAVTGRLIQRGTVLQIDTGWFIPQLWCDNRALLQLHWRLVDGVVEIQKLSNQQARLIWRDRIG